MKLNNVSSVVYQFPFGKGRNFRFHLNPVVDAILGGWELTGHQYREYRHPA